MSDYDDLDELADELENEIEDYENDNLIQSPSSDEPGQNTDENGDSLANYKRTDVDSGRFDGMFDDLNQSRADLRIEELEGGTEDYSEDVLTEDLGDSQVGTNVSDYTDNFELNDNLFGKNSDAEGSMAQKVAFPQSRGSQNTMKSIDSSSDFTSLSADQTNQSRTDVDVKSAKVEPEDSEGKAEGNLKTAGGVDFVMPTNDRENLIKGRLLARRGVFSAHELVDESLFSTGKVIDRYGSKRYQGSDISAKDLNDPGCSDKHCILRLPEHIANLVKTRLESSEDPGITFEPTGRYDYREYKVTISGLDKPLYGILGELPCIIEAHKTLNNDLLFKSADISQMMVVYEDDVTSVADDLINRMWEWPSGLTPATKNIRKRKFKNFEVFSNEEIKDAEREALILLNGLIRDTFHYEIKSAQEVHDLVQSYRNGNIKERIIGPDEDIDVYIKALEEQETEDLPDLSEIMFDADANSISSKFIYNALQRKANK
ncbi:hypothetical protein BEWA_023350 [Theileria equi strain WA]|uniref:TAFII55 protein conserved region domain-containing protein n=1 Tax=Theileria equi strain WA TaxID=1537102 RepID=L0AWU4_THEEQ|nr:hypothetical protein BEWA_023350 [Theileria equi strain WA]AFZ79486.1 hypothetical protein BEWA_023350 [Theileria equi strain WA]|eukprot:XP_004829152.1 hypothetical protein BEWA_023350 [Theileria equi strain WA]